MRICRRVAGSLAWRFFFMRCPGCRSCQRVFSGSLRAPSWVGSMPSQAPVSGLGALHRLLCVGLGASASGAFLVQSPQTFPWPEPPSCGLLCLSGSLGIDKEIDTRHSIYGCSMGSHHAQGFQGQRPFSRPSEGAPCHFSSVCPLFQALTHRNDINPGALSQTVC